MDLTSKKAVKQLIKLACSIGVASKVDLMILYTMSFIKLEDLGMLDNFSVNSDELGQLLVEIRNNAHLMALMRVKNKK